MPIEIYFLLWYTFFENKDLGNIIMGIIQEFKEFMDLKRGKTYQTNTLYYGKIGQADVYEQGDYLHSEIHYEKYVILQKADSKELKKSLIKKYGDYCGDVWWTRVPDFAHIKNTEYYKVISRPGLFVPATNTKILCSSLDNRGHYDIVSDIKQLNSLYKHGVGFRLGDTISHDDLLELENMINLASMQNDKSM